MKKVLFFLSFAACFILSSGSVFGQQVPPPKNMENAENMIVIATTNIRQAEVVRQKEDFLEVKYTVSNETGVQTGIRASLGLSDDKNFIIAEEKSSEVFSLGENETVTRTASMKIPDFLKGEFTPVVSLATEGGLFLSMHPLDKKITLSGANGDYIRFQGCFLIVGEDESKKFFAAQGVDVAANEDLIAHCSAQNMSSKSQTVTPSVTEYRRSSFGKKTNEYKRDPVTFAPNEKKEFVFAVVKNSEPQAYRQVIALLDANGKKISDDTFYHYVLQGESATIQNVVLDKNSYKKGDVATITFTYTNSADRFTGARKEGGTPIRLSAIFRVTDEKGVACAAEKVNSFEGDLFQKETVTMEKDCPNPSVSASIQNNDGKVLDSRTVSVRGSDSKSAQEEKLFGSEGESRKIKYFAFIAIGSFITLFGLILVFGKKLRAKSKGMKIFLFLLFSGAFGVMGMFPNDAKANTYGSYACSGYCIQGMTVTVDAWRTFTPGQSVGVPVYVNLNLCANALMNADLSYWMNGYSGTFFNRGWGYNAGDNYPQQYFFYPWFAAPSSEGTFSMTFWGSMREEHCGYYPEFSCPAHLIGYTYYNFTVPYVVLDPNPIPKGGAAANKCSYTMAWACDPSNYWQPLDVQIWEHGLSDFWNSSKFRGSFTAYNGLGTPWLVGQCGGNGNAWGYKLIEDKYKDGGWHYFYHYAINIPAGSNPNIGNVWFSCPPPVTGLAYQCNPEGTQVTFSWNNASPAQGIWPSFPYTYLVRSNGGVDNIWWFDGESCDSSYPGSGIRTVNGDYCGNTFLNSFTADITPNTPVHFWVHQYNGGTDLSDPATSQVAVTCSPKPAVDFKASVNGGSFGYVVNATKGDDIRFNWSSANATKCQVSGFGAGLFGDVNNLPVGGDRGPFKAGDQVKDGYAMTCFDANGKVSDPKTVTINVHCEETGFGGWTECTESCGGGTQTRSRTKQDCSTESESRSCNTQACQPHGFQEVKP